MNKYVGIKVACTQMKRSSEHMKKEGAVHTQTWRAVCTVAGRQTSLGRGGELGRGRLV